MAILTPLCTATQRLVETLNRQTKAAPWPGDSTILLEVLILAFHATDVVQAFSILKIQEPNDLNQQALQHVYERLIGKYRADAIIDEIADSWYYRHIAGNWGVSVNRDELKFLLHEVPKLVDHPTFSKLVEEAGNSRNHSLAWVMAACRRQHDRDKAGRRRSQFLRDQQNKQLAGLDETKRPASPDVIASMLIGFKTAIEDAKIIQEYEKTDNRDS